MGMSGCVGMAGGPAACRCTGCPRTMEVAQKPSKMKMLKKIKKKMGIGRAACIGGSGPAAAGAPHGPLPALTFHAAHGDNVHLSRDTSTARRVESFCKGVAFSARQVAPNERICIRFTETSANWSGVLRFGYTSQDPALLAGALPKYACPDLTNKPGYWAKALAERLCRRGGLLCYYVTHAGDVHFSIDGEDKGVFFCGVETKGPLWALLDIYGNCTGVQFVDSRSLLNNRPHSQEVQHPQHYPAHHPHYITQSEPEQVGSVDALIPALRSASITGSVNGDSWRPAALHRTCGRHVRLGPEPGVAARLPTEFNQGYVFTQRPLAPGESLLIKVLETERSYVGALAIGLTSCDPSRLSPLDLPDDSDSLLDRPEYWVVSKDVAGALRAGEDLVLVVTATGEVRVAVNGGPPATVMHVDDTLRLWAFLDVFGATRKVQVLSRPPPAVLVVALPPTHAQAVTSATSSTSLPMNVVNAPMSPPPALVNQRNHLASANITRATSAGAIAHPAVMQMVAPNTHVSVPAPHVVPQAIYGPAQGAGHASQSTLAAGSLGECNICYEHSVDSVLYTCGHMCMCYGCAVQQWRGKGGGMCPMCRAPIRDVIRAFKS